MCKRQYCCYGQRCFIIMFMQCFISYGFQLYPVKYNVGACKVNNGPSTPVVYDYGDAETTTYLYGPNTRSMTENIGS